MDLKKIIPAAVMMIFGILLIAAGLFILPPCDHLIETANGGGVPMKCHWSVVADAVLGGIILCGGIMSLFVKRDTASGIFMAMIPVCIAGILIPACIIGGCSMPTMKCRALTFPALYVLNTLCCITAVICSVLTKKKEERR